MTREEREKAIDLLDNLIGMIEDNRHSDYDKALKMAVEALKKEPCEVGHWVKIGDRGLGWSDTVICKCSKCGYQKEFAGKFDGHNLIVDMERVDSYCPNCGAKMESEDENE